MTFFNSRTFPGHRWTTSAAIASRREFLPGLARRGFHVQEMPRRRLDVVEALAQRREDDREDVEAIVQIFAKLADRDDLLEMRARRRDDSAFDRELLEAAEPPNSPRLERAEELRLQRARQVVHFVEEQRSVARELEQTLFAGVRAAECAALVTEQLRLEQRFGDRRAIDGDERLVRRRARRSEFRAKTAPCPCRFLRSAAPSCGGRPRRCPRALPLREGRAPSDDIRKTKGAGVGRARQRERVSRLASGLRWAGRNERSEERLCSPP